MFIYYSEFFKGVIKMIARRINLPSKTKKNEFESGAFTGLLFIIWAVIIGLII